MNFFIKKVKVLESQYQKLRDEARLSFLKDFIMEMKKTNWFKGYEYDIQNGDLGELKVLAADYMGTFDVFVEANTLLWDLKIECEVVFGNEQITSFHCELDKVTEAVQEAVVALRDFTADWH